LRYKLAIDIDIDIAFSLVRTFTAGSISRTL